MDEPVVFKDTSTEWSRTDSYTDNSVNEEQSDEEEDHPDILKLMKMRKDIKL